MTMFAKSLLESKRSKFPYKMNMQFFASKGEDSGDDPEDKKGDDTPSLAELLKNPEFKEQYESDMKEKLGKRLSKYKNVDLEEYERLKAEANKSKDEPNKDNKSDKEEPSKIEQHEKRFALAERKEKRAAVKEYSVEQGFNPRLAAKLLDIDSVEMDEDGEAQNLDELFDELKEDFPDLFKEKEEQEEKGYGYKPGASQKNNKGTKKPDSREIGKSAYQRAKQRGRIK